MSNHPHRRKRFVPASSSSPDDDHHGHDNDNAEEVGAHVSALYSQIISSTSSSSSSSSSKSKPGASSSTTTSRNGDGDSDGDNVQEVEIIQYCTACNTSVSNMVEHTKTSVHMFNTASSLPKPTSIALPESNKGYKMLKDKMGWKEDEGLGAQSQGIKVPIRAVQKRDRKGVGNKSTTPVVDRKKRKITYDPAGSDSVSKQERKQQISAEKLKMNVIRDAVFNDFEYLV